MSQNHIKIDLEKGSNSMKWEKPATSYDIQYFLEFANFYCWFIEGYSPICTLLFNLLKTANPDKGEPAVYQKCTNKAL